MNVKCRLSDASTIEATVDKDATVADLKKALSGPANCPPDAQKIVFKGRILKDDDTLVGYGACVRDAYDLDFVNGTRQSTSVVPSDFFTNANLAPRVVEPSARV